MSKMEIIYWFLFSFIILSFVMTYISYRKSFDIIKPEKRMAPVLITPEQFYLIYEKIFFKSTDGVELSGWFVPAGGGETNKTMIVCHGWGSNKGEILKDTWFLAENGFNLFYFDFRMSGESKGKMASLGYLETRDLEGAIRFLKTVKTEESSQLYLYGCSMGASVVVYAARHYKDIKAIILESPFLSYKSVIKNWSWGRLKVPYFPMVMMTLYFVRFKLKIDPELYSPVSNISDVSTPTLIISGDNDDLVSVEQVKRLFELCSSKEKYLWIVKGSSHAKCPEVGGKVFIEKVMEFLNGVESKQRKEEPYIPA